MPNCSLWISCISTLSAVSCLNPLADFSSAFNTMQPHIFTHKLISNFSLQHDLVLWIVNFLTDVNKCLWTCPKGKLSLVLNHPRRASSLPSSTVCIQMTAAVTKRIYSVKFVDDSALLSLLLGTQDGHRAALSDFTELEWCGKSRDHSWFQETLAHSWGDPDI